MKNINRRVFLRDISVFMITAPLVATASLIDIGKQRRKAMPQLETGSVLTAEFLNEMIERINELEKQ